MKYLIIFICITGALFNCNRTNNVAGAADDVNSGSISGMLLTKEGKQIEDTVTVSLYDDDIAYGLSKVRAESDTALKTIKSCDGTYKFDSLAAGTYRVAVTKDSIVIGEKRDITLKRNVDKEVDITIVIIINQTFNIFIDESRNITINNFYIQNGKITLSDSGYILTTVEADTIVFEIEVEKDGDTSVITVQTIRKEDGSTTFEIVDSGDIDITIISETDSRTNHAPYFTTLPDEMLDNVIAETAYLDTIHADDPDGDALTMTLLINPEEMTLDDSIISWTPGISDTGSHSVDVMVSDGNGGFDTLSWTIHVIPSASGNHAPLIVTLPGDMKVLVNVDSLYLDTIHATDADDDPIAFSFNDSVPGITLTDSIVSWTPTANDTGLHAVSVVANDGNEGMDTLEWNIRVLPNADALTQPQEVGYDTLITGEINPELEVDKYQFQGIAGDKVSLRTQCGDGLSLTVSILDASNGVVETRTSGIFTGGTILIDTLALPRTETYIIQIKSTDGGTRGIYSFMLYSRNRQLVNSPLVQYERSFSDSIAYQLQMNCYLFQGIAEDKVGLRTQCGDGLSLTVSILDAYNGVVETRTSGIFTGGTILIDTLTLPRTETYMIQIQSTDGGSSGTYTSLLTRN